jgi:hypothetical protein
MPWMPDRVRHDEKRLKAVFIVIFILKNRQTLGDLPVQSYPKIGFRKGYFFIFFMKTASALLAAASAFSAAFSALAAAASALWAAISAFLTEASNKAVSHSHFAAGGEGGGGGGGGTATTATTLEG